MSRWKQKAIGDIPCYYADPLNWLPGIIQGFTTRHGGVSQPPYDALNLALHVGDDEQAVRTNRERVLSDLGFRVDQVAFAEQIHGDGIAVVSEGGGEPVAGADALITRTPELLLMMHYADCVPVYLVDPTRRVVALIHAGWRGALAGIVPKTVRMMGKAFDCDPRSCLAAVGPCIAAENYVVGPDVADRFRNFPGGADTGASIIVMPLDDIGRRYTLDLPQIIFTQLLSAGLKAEYIWMSGLDTYANSRDFFSYRRDGVTGRMAGFIALTDCYII